MFTQNKPPARAGWPADVRADPDWAWKPFEPNRRRPWNLPWAGHLFRRATFGANWGQLRKALADGPERTVEGLLDPEADVAAFNRSADDFEAAAADSAEALRACWPAGSDSSNASTTPARRRSWASGVTSTPVGKRDQV